MHKEQDAIASNIRDNRAKKMFVLFPAAGYVSNNDDKNALFT